MLLLIPQTSLCHKRKLAHLMNRLHPVLFGQYHMVVKAPHNRDRILPAMSHVHLHSWLVCRDLSERITCTVLTMQQPTQFSGHLYYWYFRDNTPLSLIVYMCIVDDIVVCLFFRLKCIIYPHNHVFVYRS